MNRRRLSLILIAVVLFIIAIACVLFYRGRPGGQLSGAKRENILLDNILNNVILPVKGGKAQEKLSIEEKRNFIYAWLTRINPILGFEGADLNALRQSVGALEQSIGALGSVYDWQEAVTGDKFQPVGFLKLLPDLETARRQAIETGTADAINKYNQLLYQALEAYARAIDETVAQYKKLEDLDYNDETQAVKPEYYFNFLRTKTDWLKLEAALESLKIETVARRSELDRRTKCLTNSDVCDEIIGGNPIKYLSEALAPGAGAGFAEPIAPTLKARPIMDGYLSGQTAYRLADKVYGVATPCFGDSGYSYFYEAKIDGQAAAKSLGLKGDELPALDMERLFYLNDSFFVRVNPKLDNSSPYMRPLLTAGYKWHNLVETNFYMCSDLDYQARLTTLVRTSQELVGLPLEKFKDENITAQKSKLAEAKLVNGEMALKLLAQIDKRLASSSENQLAKLLGAADLAKLESILEQYKENSSELPALITSAAFYNRTLPRLKEINGSGQAKKISLVFLYSTHSYPSLLFLPFNRSLVTEAPSFGETVKEEKVKNYSQLNEVSKTYGEKELISLFGVSRKLYNP